MKKTLSLVVALVMVLACLSCVIVSAEDEVTTTAVASTNAALGMTYTTSGIYADASGAVPYPDTDAKELTDGIKPTDVSYTDAGWVGFNANSTEYGTNGYAEIVIDLGAVTDITGVNVVVNNAGNSGIGAPAEFTYSYSADGTTWTDIGAGAYDSDVATIGTVVNNNVSAAVSAQFVKIHFTAATGSGWMFIGEAEVLTAGTSEETSDESVAETSDVSVDESVADTSDTETPSTGDTGLAALVIVSVIALAGAVIVKKSK